MRLLAHLLALVALACASSVQAQHGPWVSGERALGPRAAEAPRLHLSAQAKAKALARIELTAPDAADMAALRARNQASSRTKRVAIGLNRPLAGLARTHGSELAWSDVDGGSAAQAS